MQQVATYVIIYRLADGRGWRQDSLPSSATFTSMQFNDGVPKMAITGMCRNPYIPVCAVH